MKRISVRVALAFTLVCLVLVVAAGVDLVSRVAKCKIYVLQYDPANLQAIWADDLGLRTREIQDDLLLIAQNKTVFRELVYRDDSEAPFVFYGGPAPVTEGNGAILLFVSAGSLYSDTVQAAIWIAMAGALLVCLLAILAFFVTDRLLRPLRQMTAQTRRLAQGLEVADVSARTRDEIGELARAFNYMKTRMHENEKARQEFLASVSHDIRTPLTHIRTSALGLKDGWLPDAMRDRAIDIIADESLRLIGMTNDLIETARIQSSSLELRLSVVELASLLQEAAERSPDPTAVQVNCDPGLRVSIDESLLRRVLTNLLDNAFRYGRPPVELSGWKADGACHVTVRDHGAGVPVAELPRVFERFYRVNTSGEPQLGSGIGLHFAQRALELHGGQIVARNAPGGGLLLHLSWPDAMAGL